MENKVMFILPRPSEKIAGGYKVVYDYANYLSSKGLKIIIGYNCSDIGQRFKVRSTLIKKAFGNLKLRKSRWYSLNNKIEERVLVKSSDIAIDSPSIVIGTAVNTIPFIESSVINFGRIKKIGYFIQGYETWISSEREITNSFRNDYYKITVSKWLKEIVQKESSTPVQYIPNGIDSSIFYRKKTAKYGEGIKIAFMYHQDRIKGMDIIQNVIAKLRTTYPKLKFIVFGAFDKPNWLGDSVEYHAFASQEEVANIMNQASIFISSSYEEGFGLTGLESMACGCALATTKTKGSLEYCNEFNCLMSEPGNPQELYLNVCRLIEDEELRNQLVKEAVATASKFSLSKSRELFYGCIQRWLDD